MSQKLAAAALAAFLAVTPLAGCTAVMTGICKHSPAVLDNLEILQRKLEIVRAFLSVATTADLQVELELQGTTVVITRGDIDNALALIDHLLGTIKNLIADACAGNVEQTIKAAAAVEANPAVSAAMAMARRAGAISN